jgi:hypothetical protein
VRGHRAWPSSATRLAMSRAAVLGWLGCPGLAVAGPNEPLATCRPAAGCGAPLHLDPHTWLLCHVAQLGPRAVCRYRPLCSALCHYLLPTNALCYCCLPSRVRGLGRPLTTVAPSHRSDIATAHATLPHCPIAHVLVLDPARVTTTAFCPGQGQTESDVTRALT